VGEFSLLGIRFQNWMILVPALLVLGIVMSGRKRRPPGG
jgi:hypothetical protein